MKFTFGSGQRPVDGYTLKRGIGKGGFGEVYFAVSDGGKEVALKLVRGDQDVELRGVSQCLNLKHPNLVALYDLRTDRDGSPWVIMEYVSGEPLTAILNRHPKGVSIELAQQWFEGLARAVGYLHDQGIVHRDLKPANIFVENGSVKVGDYGLSKLMSDGQRSAQTQSVGTVHYMAPEISTGNYNRQIDIYASGIILYEMLTGRVPFDGESAGEILMKHLTTPPDLSKLPAAFVPIVGKALAKNPAHRYATMAEMARAVETVGTERHPEVVPVPAAPVKPPRKIASVRPEEPVLTVLPVVSMGGQVAELCGSMALSTLFAAIGCLFLAGVTHWTNLTDVGQVFFLTVAASWMILLPAKVWGSRPGESWIRRLIMLFAGAGVGLSGLWLSGWFPNLPSGGETYRTIAFQPLSLSGQGLSAVTTAMCYFGLVFFALRWWRLADRRRSQRFSFAPLLGAAFWSYMLLLPWPSQTDGAVAMVLASAIVQLASPWEKPVPATPRRVRMRYA